MKITNKMIVINDINELAPNNEGPIVREVDGRMLKYEFHKDNIFGRATDYDFGELILEIPMDSEPIEYDEQWLNEPYGPFELLEFK